MTHSADYFLDAQREPKIEFFQADEKSTSKEKKKFKLRFQLEGTNNIVVSDHLGIMNQYIRENWPSLSGKKIKATEYNSLKASGNISAPKDKQEK
jgi:hypothetical protein